MIDSDVILGPWFFDALVDALGYVGRPLQRRRARRLARNGKVRCALFGASSPRVLGTRQLDWCPPLEWQAEEALSMLGFGDAHHP